MDIHLRRLLVAANFISGLPDDVEQPDDFAPILPYLAVAGVALALGTGLLAALCLLALPSLSAMVIGTILVSTLWFGVSRGQNLGALGQLIGHVEPLVRRNDDEPNEMVRPFALFVLVALKLTDTAILLVNGSWTWLPLVPLASILFASELSLAMGFLPVGEDAARTHRLMLIIFVAAGLVAGLQGLFAMLFVLLLLYVLCGWVRQRGIEWPELVNGGSELAECLMLILGLILL